MINQQQQTDGEISPQAYQLAAAYEMGTPVAEYGTRSPIERLLYCVIYFLVPAVLLVVIFTNRNINNYARIVGLAICAISLLAGLITLFIMLKADKQRVFIFASGFIHQKGQKINAVRWDQIESVIQKVKRSYRFTIYFGSTFLYKVRRYDGAVVTLDDNLRDIALIGETVIKEAARFHLPHATVLFQCGDTLTFGPIKLNLQGIEYKKSGMSWDEFKGMDVTDEYITIKAGNQQTIWNHIPVSSIPNALIFVEMVDYAIQMRQMHIAQASPYMNGSMPAYNSSNLWEIDQLPFPNS